MTSDRPPATVGSVTSLVPGPSAPPSTVGPDVRPAEVAATEAAVAAGVEVHEIGDPRDFAQVNRLFGAIWGTDDHAGPVASELMRALEHAGNYVVGAFEDDRLCGACVGFFGPPDRHTLHSHIAGVGPSAQGRNVGYALKLHQHAWSLRRGIREITWTFDPLVRRNAYFNVAKLGALPTAYLPDFYGAMGDGINNGHDSDRLLVSWRVGPTVGRSRRETVPPGSTIVLDEAADGRPVEPGGRTGGGSCQLVRVPADIEALRLQDPVAARAWRTAVRDLLGGLLAEGGRVVGFSRQGFYVVEGAAS